MAANPNRLIVPPPGSYSDASRKTVAGKWITRPSDPFWPEAMFPEADPSSPVSDRLFDINNLVNSEPVPEITPIFTGLRKQIAERRLGMHNKRVERRVKDAHVLRHVAELIVEEKSYRVAHDKFRPRTIRQLYDSQRLNKFNRRRKQRIRSASNIAAVYSDLPGGELEVTAASTPDFKGHSDIASVAEHYSNYKNRTLYERLGGEIELHEHLFNKVLSGAQNRADKTVVKRNKLAKKTEKLAQLHRDRAAPSSVTAIKNAGKAVHSAWKKRK